MPQALTRALAAVLALLGVACAAVGIWLMSSLGTDGRATFTAQPGTRTVVLPPSVLNRVDSDVTVEAEAPGAVWMGLARPSDVDSVMKDAEVARATGVSVPSWTLRTSTSGSGTADPAGYDLWEGRSTGEGTAKITVDQEAAPQTLVVSAPEGEEIGSVTMSVSDTGWFTRAVVLTLLGLALLVPAVLMLLRSRRRDDAEQVDGEYASVEEPAAVTEVTEVSGVTEPGETREAPRLGSSTPDHEHPIPLTDDAAARLRGGADRPEERR